MATAEMCSPFCDGASSSCSLVDRQDLLDLVDDQPGGAGAGLDDDDLALLALPRRKPEALLEVADRDDLAAQVDHAAHREGDDGIVRGSGVADDLLDLP